MKGLRIGWFDVVGRALPDLDPAQVGRAIERLSATYRAGGADLDFESEVGRAAYLWHHLPAHVCDLARLFLDVPGLVDDDRATVRLLGLGAGPGTEALALLDALTAARARGELPDLARVEVRRVDRTRAWDASFERLLAAARPFLRQRDPDLDPGPEVRPRGGPDPARRVAGPAGDAGEGWTLDAPGASLEADLAVAAPPAVLEAVAVSDVVVASNLLTEVAPRGTDDLPRGLRGALAAIYAAARPGTDVLLVDRARAPGAEARLEAAARLALEVDPTAYVDGPRARQTRCACPLTRAVKALYEHVHLPTTRDADRPALNCQTLWWHVRLGAPERPDA